MKKKKNFRAKRKGSPVRIESGILRMFRRFPKTIFSEEAVVQKLDLSPKIPVSNILAELVAKNLLVPIEGKFRLAEEKKATLIKGEVDLTKSGSAFILSKDFERDIFVPPHLVNGALQGDMVNIKLTFNKAGKRPEGKVVEIVERVNEYFLVTVHVHSKYATVVPDKRQLPFDIIVELDDLNGAKDGEKAVVKIVKWPSRKFNNLKAVVTIALGKLGPNDAEMNAILVSNGFRLAFPEEVVSETEKLKTTFEKGVVLDDRRDFRDTLTFTIDPATARDFDDALSFKKLDNGNMEIGVHIADVTHFVQEGTALDQEAYLRATSVYLVDRVLPMLPEILSNDLCSLVPNEDRYVFSAVFEFDDSFKVKNRWFGKSVIHSNQRFAYEEAQELMDSEDQSETANVLRKLNTIAKFLRAEKMKKGAINFETDEVRFELDDEGKPVSVYVKERKEIHLLIEEFMLLANREVAAYVYKKGNGSIPFVFRVHDLPNTDKVADLSLFAKQFGVTLDISTPQSIAQSFNALSDKAKEVEGAKVLESIAIRTMAKAVYTTENIGHYGLGFDFYTHFTSPIRRYSDVLVHRILQMNLGEGMKKVDKAALETKCLHISKMERRAMESERESIRNKQVEFLVGKVGEHFDGVVSGIIERGIFVILSENHCEGMVSFNSMRESFEVGPGRLYARGQSSGLKLQMGDKIRVKIMQVDLEKKRVEFELVD